MRLLTPKELGRIFTLRESGKARTRKKNHKRAMKYLNKYGLRYAHNGIDKTN